MERRETHRTRRRVPCLFSYEGHVHSALVVDVSVGGMFLQTDMAVSPGTELTLRLRGDAFEDVELRGRVVRRRFTPTVIATLIRRGVGVRILSAPPAYYDALGASQAVEGSSWSPLQDLLPPFEPRAYEPPVTVDAQPAPLLGVSPAWDEKTDERIAAAEGVWESVESEAAAVAAVEPEPVWSPKASWRADALLIHDGELADIVGLLERMGADILSQRGVDACGVEGWERPPRLIVANGVCALRLALGSGMEAQGIVAIAVVDSESQTLCGMLRRQGFRYVVRRPVHPEALRLLLGRALFRGRERRDAVRASLGCKVTLRFGLRRRSATLLELSRTGCRLATNDWVEPGDPLSVRVPSELTGNRPLVLSGRVLRSQRQSRAGTGAGVAVGLRFDRLADSTRTRLEALISAHTLGPTPLGRSASPGGLGGWRPHAQTPPSGAVAARARTGHDEERRQGRRRLHRHEVIALDAELRRVRYALLGVDLSAGGVRVEPHPEIALGDRLRIAIYEAAAGAPILVDAVAIRDDGARGVVLRFRDVSAGVAREIARVVEGAPQLEAGGGGEGVVVAELIDCQPS